MDERISNFLNRNSKTIPNPAPDLAKQAPSAIRESALPPNNNTTENALADRILAISQAGEETEAPAPRLQGPNSRQRPLAPSNQSASMTATAPLKRIPSLRSSVVGLDRKPFINHSPNVNVQAMNVYHHQEPGNFSRQLPSSDALPPTMSGLGRDDYRHEILSANPRIPEYLLERMTQEQLRRHDRLNQLIGNHSRLRQSGRCPSGSHCCDPKDYFRWFETAHTSTMSGLKGAGSKFPSDESGQHGAGRCFRFSSSPFVVFKNLRNRDSTTKFWIMKQSFSMDAMSNR